MIDLCSIGGEFSHFAKCYQDFLLMVEIYLFSHWNISEIGH